MCTNIQESCLVTSPFQGPELLPSSGKAMNKPRFKIMLRELLLVKVLTFGLLAHITAKFFTQQQFLQ
uniref:Uncharacterized protein n=1 Tax=Arundo donax TaxID=35708 RepID=A0A0A8Y373_ARUDO